MSFKAGDYVIWRQECYRVLKIRPRTDTMPESMPDIADLKYVCELDGSHKSHVDPRFGAWLTDLEEPPAMLVLAMAASE